MSLITKSSKHCGNDFSIIFHTIPMKVAQQIIKFQRTTTLKKSHPFFSYSPSSQSAKFLVPYTQQAFWALEIPMKQRYVSILLEYIFLKTTFKLRLDMDFSGKNKICKMCLQYDTSSGSFQITRQASEYGLWGLCCSILMHLIPIVSTVKSYWRV